MVKFTVASVLYLRLFSLIAYFAELVLPETFAQIAERGRFEFIQHLVLQVAGAHGAQKPESLHQ